MTSELRRRLLITFAALGGVWLLRFIPLPGVRLPAMSGFGDPGDPFVMIARSNFLDRGSLGGHGILPYATGSMLATLFAFLRAPGPAGHDPRGTPGWMPAEPRLAVALSLAYAGIQACGSAIWLENLGTDVVAQPGPMFLTTACVTSIGATMLIIRLARLISSRGIGNGGLLVLGLANAQATLNALYARAMRHADEGPAAWTFPLLLVVGGIALAGGWLSLRWTLGEPAVEGSGTSVRIPAVPTFPVSGVGVMGVMVAMSLLDLSKTLADFLPTGDPFATWAARIMSGLPYLALLVVTGAGATYAITAWANDAAVLRRALGLWPDLARRLAPFTDGQSYDRTLSRIAVLPVLGVPLGCAVFTFLAWRVDARGLQAPSLLALTAIVLESRRQWRSHRALALSATPGEHDAVCGRCGCPVSTSDPYCAACGIVVDGDLPCADHAQVPAVTRCVVCQRAMCDDCTRLVEDRAVCEAHATVRLVEGWASLGDPITELEAEVIQARLADRKIEAMVLANTWAPAYGTFGLYQVLPAVPLAAHSRCGGASIKVLVRPADWIAAMEVCRESPESSASALASPIA